MVFRKEQNVSCGDYFAGSRLYGSDLGEVQLLECVECGFGCFPHMRAWGPDCFREKIYNRDYPLCDPAFGGARPRKLAAWLAATLKPCKLLDYGGGAGLLANILTADGFTAFNYDPFYGAQDLSITDADVVTAFEVVEHVPDQTRLFASLRDLCNPGGIIVFSTLLKAQRHSARDWWYASARNGHVSFHTANSLDHIGQSSGLHVRSLSSEIHVAAHEPATLKIADGWQAVSVSGHPEFAFDQGWATLAPV